MSLATLDAIAAQRTVTAPRRPKREPKTEADAASTELASYTSVLVAAIPTEPLAMYTFLTGVVVATIDAGESERLGLRWGIYVVAVLFIAAWLFRSHRRRRAEANDAPFPVAPIAAAAVAFSTWALAMPESPLWGYLNGDDRIVWTSIITVAGVAMLALITGTLAKPAKN